MQLLWCAAFTVGLVQCVTFPKLFKSSSQLNNVVPREIIKDGEDEFGVCLRSGDPILPCLSSGASRTLESASTLPELDLGEGLRLVQELDMSDDMVDPDDDRREVGAFLDHLGAYMRGRYLLWNMDFVYPGLMMRVGSADRGFLKFLVDQRRAIDERALSTGALMMKRTILPILLGFKIKVATLLPLLFAGLIILVKKALFLSKFSLLLSGLSFLRGSGFGSSSHDGSYSVFGSSGSSSLYGGGGLGTFGPTKHVIIDRPVNWFEREGQDAFLPPTDV